MQQTDDTRRDSTLAGAGTAGQHGDFFGESHFQRRFLLLGHLDRPLTVEEGEGGLPVHATEGSQAISFGSLNAAETVGSALFCVHEGWQVNGIILGNQFALANQLIDLIVAILGCALPGVWRRFR